MARRAWQRQIIIMRMVHGDLHAAQQPAFTVTMGAGASASFCRKTAEGLLFRTLAPLVAAALPKARKCLQGPRQLEQLQRLLATPLPLEQTIPLGQHEVPDWSHVAPPVHVPIEKDRIRLQVRNKFAVSPGPVPTSHRSTLIGSLLLATHVAPPLHLLIVKDPMMLQVRKKMQLAILDPFPHHTDTLPWDHSCWPALA